METPINPNFTPSEAEDLLYHKYGKKFKAEGLPSYIDQNFKVKDEKGVKYIFKIFNRNEDKLFVDATVKILNYLTTEGFKGKTPEIIPTTNGEDCFTLEGANGYTYKALLLSYLEGTFLVDVKTHSEALINNLGSFMGQLDRTLSNFSYPGLNRIQYWDIKNAHHISDKIKYISNLEKRRIADYFLFQFETSVLPKLRKCRESVIHNDANDYNLLVKEDAITGLIDFGDMGKTNTINELAVAATYIMLDKDDPIAVAEELIKGYHGQYPLMEEEIDILYELICTRLSFSVINSAYSSYENPKNEYINVSEEQAWKLLYKILEINPVKPYSIFREACGYSRKTIVPKEELLQKRKSTINTALSVSYKKPLHIVKGTYQYLYDDVGNTYLDCVDNVSHVGHGNPRVVRAAIKQMANLNTNTRFLHQNLVNYAEELLATLPDHLETCIFTCTGSEANDLALRMARTVTGRQDVIVLEGAYHGTTTAVIEASPYKFDGKGGAGAQSYIHQVSTPDPYRGKFAGQEDQTLLYSQEMKKTVDNLAQMEQPVAGFICESLLGCGGQIVMPDKYMAEAFKIVKDAGGIGIADEVQVGFGRVGTQFWGFETQGAVPDIVTLGKPIGNGHPLGAVVTTREIAEAFDNGMEYFNTFGGNPVSCAVGLEVLKIIQEDGLQEEARKIGDYLLQQFDGLKEKYELIGDVRGLGLFLGIELVKDRNTMEPAKEEASMIINKMKDKGILLSTDGPYGNVIKFKPPMVFNMHNADQLVDNLDQVLGEMDH